MSIRKSAIWITLLTEPVFDVHISDTTQNSTTETTDEENAHFNVGKYDDKAFLLVTLQQIIIHYQPLRHRLQKWW